MDSSSISPVVIGHMWSYVPMKIVPLWQRDQQHIDPFVPECARRIKTIPATKPSCEFAPLMSYAILIRSDSGSFGFVLEELCKDLNSMDFSEGSPKAGMQR